MKTLSTEEIRAKLDNFPIGFEKRFGKPLDYNLLRAYLHIELSKIERQLIDEAFSSLSPETIRLILKEIEPKTSSESQELQDNQEVHIDVKNNEITVKSD